MAHGSTGVAGGVGQGRGGCRPCPFAVPFSVLWFDAVARREILSWTPRAWPPLPRFGSGSR
jgi:hypothetical protein